MIEQSSCIRATSTVLHSSVSQGPFKCTKGLNPNCFDIFWNFTILFISIHPVGLTTLHFPLVISYKSVLQKLQREEFLIIYSHTFIHLTLRKHVLSTSVFPVLLPGPGIKQWTHGQGPAILAPPCAWAWSDQKKISKRTWWFLTLFKGNQQYDCISFLWPL